MDIFELALGDQWQLYEQRFSPGRNPFQTFNRNFHARNIFLVTEYAPVLRFVVDYTTRITPVCRFCWQTDHNNSSLYPSGSLTTYICENCLTQVAFTTSLPSLGEKKLKQGECEVNNLMDFENALTGYLEALGFHVFDTIVNARELTEKIGSIRGQIVSANIR